MNVWACIALVGGSALATWAICRLAYRERLRKAVSTAAQAHLDSIRRGADVMTALREDRDTNWMPKRHPKHGAGGKFVRSNG